MNQKKLGAYYTPAYLSRFIARRVFERIGKKCCVSILEPSVGDGSFINALKEINHPNIQLTALDIKNKELLKAKNKWHSGKGTFTRANFLTFKRKSKLSVIIGNPPYVKKDRLSMAQFNRIKKIHTRENLTVSSAKNIWTAFLIKSIKLLKTDGILAFILPSELLQVKFTEEIRDYLKTQFERIEIFTFSDLMFECKGQDTVVLFAYKKANEKGEFFANIESKDVLENNTFELKKNNLLVSSKVKWTHHFLDSDELTLLDNLKKKLKSVNHYSDSKPGIVTAANKFFIIDKETEKKYDLLKHTKPIIQKGLYVNGSVVFSDSNIKDLEKKKLPTKLLQFDNADRISKKVKEYLQLGIDEEIPDRYKCRKRDNWYVIPNIAEVPDAFFFKRSHLYPKLLKNNSSALVTDSAYKVQMKNGYELNSFIYSFYNTLTLILSEIEGRYYGGGVLELTPSEFKKLPIPYSKITKKQFSKFTTSFEKKANIEEILSLNDFDILNPILQISEDDMTKLTSIRNKLLKKRLRN